MALWQWGLLSLAAFLLGIVAAAACLVLLPKDYFAQVESRRFRDLSSVEKVRRVVKNLLGAALVAIGIALLFLPGQGLITVLIGLMLLDFPGKHRLVRRLLGRPRVLVSANRWRDKFGRPPLAMPHGD